MNLADADTKALKEFPEIAHLLTLREAKWSFLPLATDENGHPTQLDGFYAWPTGYTDAIRIRNSTDALGSG